MKTAMLIEHAITPAVHGKIQAMLGECFPGYPSRGYFKQQCSAVAARWTRCSCCRTDERLVDELMVKILNSKTWNPGPVDLLGYLL